ncbi:MAG TPA: zinc ribbon domain-containing protein [Terriglobales bacterium]|nr:zinc ribbon domain-containing protein [Terriglobales bacterium]
MPIYEYRCRQCHKRFTVLTLRVSEPVEPRCDGCGSQQAERLMSRFAMPKSDAARAAALEDPSSFGDLDENDPKSMARWMRRVGEEMGEDSPGGELDGMLDQIESGGDDSDD